MRMIGICLMALCLVLAGTPAVAQNTENYKAPGGALWVIGGELDVASDGVVQLDTRELTGAQLSHVSRELSSLTAAGAAFLGTQETEAILGSGSITVNADSLLAGDTIKYKFVVNTVLGVSDDTLRLRVRVGGLTGTVIADTTAIDIVTGDIFQIEGEIDIYTIGATGTGYAASTVIADIDAGATTSVQLAALSSIDTTQNITICLTGVYDASAADTNSANIVQATGSQN